MKQDLNPLSSQLTAAPKILKRRCRSVEWHRRHPMGCFRRYNARHEKGFRESSTRQNISRRLIQGAALLRPQLR